MSAQPRTDLFPREIAGLPHSRQPEIVELSDGDVFDLRIAPVVKRIGDATVRMLAYNGSIPGPTLKVRQGSEVIVNVANDGDLEATVHWHGVRVENRYDGTHETQAPIAVGGSFTYRVQFPDPGRLLVPPAHPRGLRPGDGPVRKHPRRPRRPRLLGAGRSRAPAHPRRPPARGRARSRRSAAPRRTTSRWAASATSCSSPASRTSQLNARFGEVVRFYLTNTANTRVFNVGLHGAQMKLVGGDSGRYEREEFVDEVVLAPSERAVVDVLFDKPGRVTLEHHHPDRCYPLAAITVSDDWTVPSLAAAVRVSARERGPGGRAAANRAVPRRRTRQDARLHRRDGHAASPKAPSSTPARCTPRSSATTPGHCPKCGMKLLATAAPATSYACPMHPESSATARPLPQVRHEAAAVPARRAGGRPRAVRARPPRRRPASTGRATASSGKTTWSRSTGSRRRPTCAGSSSTGTTGAENHAIDWQFQVGDQVKLRLVNEMDSDHPMHHPFHIHGAGRFLILARDGDSRAQPGLERHRARPHRPDGRHPARRHQSRRLDGALPYRRAPRERNDVQLHRHASTLRRRDRRGADDMTYVRRLWRYIVDRPLV